MGCAERGPDTGRQTRPAVNSLPRHEPPGDGAHDPRPAGGVKTRSGILVSRALGRSRSKPCAGARPWLFSTPEQTNDTKNDACRRRGRHPRFGNRRARAAAGPAYPAAAGSAAPAATSATRAAGSAVLRRGRGPERGGDHLAVSGGRPGQQSAVRAGADDRPRWSRQPPHGRGDSCDEPADARDPRKRRRPRPGSVSARHVVPISVRSGRATRWCCGTGSPASTPRRRTASPARAFGWTWR